MKELRQALKRRQDTIQELSKVREALKQKFNDVMVYSSNEIRIIVGKGSERFSYETNGIYVSASALTKVKALDLLEQVLAEVGL